MPYYGDVYAGDPGLFGFVKRMAGRVIGGIVKTAIPGAGGVLGAVQAIRAAGKPRGGGSSPIVTASPATSPSAGGSVIVPATVPAVSRAAPRARRRKLRAPPGTRFVRGKAVSAFAQRMAAARAAAARRRRG